MDENRYISEVRLRFQTTTKLSAVHQWHHPVGDNDVRSSQLHGVQRLYAVSGESYLVSLVDKNSAPCSEDFGVVVDKQN